MSSSNSNTVSRKLIALIVWGLGAALAFYLSYACNSNWHRGFMAKLVFAVFSAMGSWSYVVIYVLYKRGLCDPKTFHVATV